MKNGFIYPLTDKLISLLCSLNLVEHVKTLAFWLVSKISKRPLSEDEEISARGIAIDCFIIAKWLFVGWAIASGATQQWVAVVVWYLIASNLFTYFYYHVWKSGFAQRNDIGSQRRRYVSFLLSIGFYLACYAYLYQYQYTQHISWPGGVVDTTNAFYLSIANAFTLTYGGFSPLSQTARVVFASELINTFFFFTIIVVNSVPTGHNLEK